MKAPEIEVDINDLVDKYQLIIRIRRHRRFTLRMKLASALIELASKISPAEIFLCESVEPCEAGFSCGDVEPYGFVPECGCPLHDCEFESEDEFDEYLARLLRSDGVSDCDFRNDDNGC